MKLQRIFKHRFNRVLNRKSLPIVLLVAAITIPVGAKLSMEIEDGQLFDSDSAAATNTPERIGENYYVYDENQFMSRSADSEVVLLNFYATWCGSCNEFEPTIKDVIEEVGQTEGITAYRVNFGDSAETDAGRELAKEYGVSTQTTTIVLNRDGKVFKTFFTPVPHEDLRDTLLAAKLSNTLDT